MRKARSFKKSGAIFFILAAGMGVFQSSAVHADSATRPVITSIAYHRWTADEIGTMYSNGICRVAGQDLTNYSSSGNPIGEWCCWATTAQVTLSFSVPSTSHTYYVQWIPWRIAGSFYLDGVLYDGSLAQSWTTISGPLTTTGSSITFQSGIVEEIGFFRILMQ